uniref:Protein kinase domain-containing protein n=1 Tax=Anopheles epiroticus TaxID=199890 RepID=A0A182PPD3_9DIPT
MGEATGQISAGNGNNRPSSHFTSRIVQLRPRCVRNAPVEIETGAASGVLRVRAPWGRATGYPLQAANWNRVSDHERVHRQLSVSSDSKLLDDDIREETRVIMRPKKPPRPKSEVFLNKHDPHPRRKRFSAFGGDSPFGKSDAYIKLEQLGEGSYATVFKGYSK